jgi:ribonucleotide monophosphatase NagD (HAD superfamily)
MLLGKPSDYMKKIVLRKIHLFPEDILLIGDSLKSDIVFGNKCGFRTAIVLTGMTNLEQAKAARELQKPDFILKDIKELLR